MFTSRIVMKLTPWFAALAGGRAAGIARWAAVSAAAAVLTALPAPRAARAQGTGGDDIEPPFVECCKGNSDFANLRAGPNASDYDIVGILTFGEMLKALGQSKAGLWIQVRYPSAPGAVAWVSARPLPRRQSHSRRCTPPRRRAGCRRR
jgi:hypothetical protein